MRVAKTKGMIVVVGLVVIVPLAGCPLIPPLPSSGHGSMEINTFNRVNAERTSRGLAALVLDANISVVARRHSQDMVNRHFFSHVNPDGDGLAERLSDGGIAYNIAGENIAWNNYPDPVDTAVNGWMGSAGHRANILDNRFSRTGVGVVADATGRYYFTQVFVGFTKDLPPGHVELHCPDGIGQYAE